MRPSKPSYKWLWIPLLLIALALLLWALRRVPLREIGAVLTNLSLGQVGILLAVNSGIILLLGLRWWLILRAQGHSLPFLAITRYRLTAFGVSYFTPGPHFGGEPLQVIYVRQRHKVPGSSSLAAVTLDKIIDLWSNFVFLSLALAVVLGSGLLFEFDLGAARLLALMLLLLPMIYVLVLWRGWRPLGALARPLPERWAILVRSSEEKLAQLISQRPSLLAQTILASAFIWLALLFEYWLALLFLDLRLGLVQLLAVVVAARLAMLAPTPGALGALEAGQVLAMQALGYDPAIGLSLSLIIRARDLLFGGLGLWLGALNPL